MTAQAPPAGPQRVVLALGSNLGDRLANLQAGLDVLGSGPGLSCSAVSPVYQTTPVGGPPQPDYLNAVVIAATELPAWSVLDRCRAAEAALRRVRRETSGPRTLDVDIVVYGDVISDDPQLTLPHPRAHERGFVLAPWHDIEPDAQIPGHGPAAALLAAAGTTGVRQVPEARLTIPAAGGRQQAAHG